MMRKRWSAAFASTALTLLATISGCGGGGGDSTASSSATPTPTPQQQTFTATRSILAIDPANPDNYAAPAYPVHYDPAVRAADNTPANDPVDDRIATLGRVLFFDARLSINQAVSCGSCHRQAIGFSDSVQFSKGFSDLLFTNAHSMRIGNARFYQSGQMFWDKRAASLEAQALQPIQNAVEMGFDDAHGGLDAALARLNVVSFYKELIPWAFNGETTLNAERLARALAHFQRALVSINSRFDDAYALAYDPVAPQKGLLKDFTTVSATSAGVNFTADEEAGKRLFMLPVSQGGGGCAACHLPPSFALASNVKNNGLDAGETRVFKAPSLKNVAAFGRLTHDGRFSTLEQMVDHYISGIQAGPALDDRLKDANGAPLRLPFTNVERDRLVAFLKTLNDPVLTTQAKFADPFRSGKD